MAQSAPEVEQQLRDVISALRTPIPDKSNITALLAAPLAHFSLLPPLLLKSNARPLPDHAPSNGSLRLIPVLQRAILENVAPHWGPILEEEGLASLLDGYFCPDPNTSDRGLAGFVALRAYTTLTTAPIDGYSVKLLTRLTKWHTIYDLHETIFCYGAGAGLLGDQEPNLWDQYLKALFACPGKVANSLGDAEPPEPLKHNTYFSNLIKDCEILLYNASVKLFTASTQSRTGSDPVSYISSLFSKLISTGFFSSNSPTDPSCSFFGITRQTIDRRLRRKSDVRRHYSNLWVSTLDNLPSHQLHVLLTSLCSSTEWRSSLDKAPRTTRRITKEARLFRYIVGPLGSDPSDRDRWNAVCGAMLEKTWPEEQARTLVCWVAGDQPSGVDVNALGILLDRTLELWTSPQYIKHSFLSQHHYVTAILLLTVSHLPSTSQALRALGMSQPLRNSITTYLSHLDPSVRRCGMLAAEYIASRVGSKLSFGDWDGDEHGKDWCRQLRKLATEGDVLMSEHSPDIDSDEEAEMKETHRGSSGVEDRSALPAPPTVSATDSPAVERPIQSALNDSDDESLAGYASSRSSSPGPTPSELDEVEKDPSLNTGRSKLPHRPVYLVQLGELLVHAERGEEQQAPLKEEMALKDGAGLIRRKQGYGLELEENAVNLAITFVKLDDNYELDDFIEKREAIITALVACCPRKTAPCIIEQLFSKDLNLMQRFAILNALAFGARELAGLSSPPRSSSSLFPSKQLPAKLHRKYITENDVESLTHNQLHLLEDITREAIQKVQVDAEARPAPVQVARERQLRVKSKTPGREIVEVAEDAEGRAFSHLARGPNTFNDIAAEYFIMPMINRFWQYLQDENTREDRTKHATTRYKGAATAMILETPTLTHFLATLTLLMHASRHSPAYLAVLAPEAIQLAVTLGTRPLSSTPLKHDGIDDEAENPSAVAYGKEAKLLTTALELTLVTLDACWDLDSGKSLGLEHTLLLLGVREWAEELFKALDSGVKIEGSGALGDVKVKRTVASVLLKLDEMTSKWRQAMLQF